MQIPQLKGTEAITALENEVKFLKDENQQNKKVILLLIDSVTNMQLKFKELESGKTNDSSTKESPQE